MSKFAGFIIGGLEIVAGVILEGVPGGQAIGTALIVSGVGMVLTQAVVDLTAQKNPSRQASEMTIALGEQPRVLLLGETFTPGSLVDAFDFGGKYDDDWEVLVIRLADHPCHSLTGFYVNDDWNPYTGDGLVPRYDDQLKIYFRANTTLDPLPAIVTDNGPGWTAADIGQSGCDVIVAYKADKAKDKHPGWPAGRPHFGFVVKGAFCYDPRKDDTVAGGAGPHRDNDPSTWEWSENAEICWHKFERGVYADDDISDPTKLLVGRGLTAAESPGEYTFAAANLCDEKVGTIYPSPWVETTVAFNPTSLSPDGMTLYTISSGVLGAIFLPTRSQVLSAPVASGSGGGPSIAATDDGAYFLDSAGSLFFGTRTGTITKVIDAVDMGMIAGGVGYAGGDIWIYPHSFDPNKIGQLVIGGGFTVHVVNFSATQVFTKLDGTAMAVGTTSGDDLAIGPAGSDGTLLDTTAYGTTGPVYAFDNGTHYDAWQDNHLFLLSEGAVPAITADAAVSTLLRVYEGFAATRPGAATFWLDGTEFNSADLSVNRTPDLAPFTAASGGTPGGGYLYDPMNDALLVTTTGAFGFVYYLLDRDGSYRVAGPIYSNQPFIDVELMFAAATAGSIVTRDGTVQLEPGQAKTVVATITDDDLVVGSKASWNHGFLSESSDEWINSVVGTYVEPDQNWNSHVAPIVRSTADIIADGKPRESQITLRLVRYLAQALRIAEVARRLGRLWGRGQITLGPRYCYLEDGDWIAWQSDRYLSGATKILRIEAYSIDEKFQNTLTIREMTGEAFAPDGTFAPDLSRPTTTPPRRDVGSPNAGNWNLEAVTLDSAGASVPALEITGSASDDNYAEDIIFEYWLDDGVTDPTVSPDTVPWISYGRLEPDTTLVDITSITGGATYYAAVSYVVKGITGDRLVLGPVTVADYNTNPIIMLEDGATPLHLEDDSTPFHLG